MSSDSNKHIQKIYADHLISMNNSLIKLSDNLTDQLPNFITIATALTFTVGLIQVKFFLSKDVL